MLHSLFFNFRPEDGWVAKISKGPGYSPFRRISQKPLDLFLRCCEFLRFEKVKLPYDDFPFLSIDKKCHLFVKRLKPLRAALSDSTTIHFNASIDYELTPALTINFGGPLQILNHLRNELLPICASARCYEFTIRFCLRYVSATNILDSILQMSPIISSTNVQFNLYHSYFMSHEILTRLPVDAISAWLDRPNNMIMKHRNTPLKLKVYLDGVQNTQELFEHFKKVCFANFLIKIIKKSAYLITNKLIRLEA